MTLFWKACKVNKLWRVEVVSDTVCTCYKKLQLHQEMIGFFFTSVSGFPLGLENGKVFSSQGKKSANFEQTEKVGGIHTKYWKTREISDKCCLFFLSDKEMDCVLFTKTDQFSV